MGKRFLHWLLDTVDPMVLLLVLLVSIALIVLIVDRVAITNDEVVVMARYWRRQIFIHDYQTREYESWDHHVASDYVEIKGCYTRQSGTMTIGDVTYPVFDNWCRWTANRWAYSYTINAEGFPDETLPFWPALDFVPCESVELGCRKEDRRAEWYFTTFGENQCTYSSQDVWARYQNGTRWILPITGVFKTPICHEVKAIGENER